MDLKWPSGISISRHDAKIQKSEIHKKIDDEKILEGPLKEIGEVE